MERTSLVVEFHTVVLQTYYCIVSSPAAVIIDHNAIQTPDVLSKWKVTLGLCLMQCHSKRERSGRWASDAYDPISDHDNFRD